MQQNAAGGRMRRRSLVEVRRQQRIRERLQVLQVLLDLPSQVGEDILLDVLIFRFATLQDRCLQMWCELVLPSLELGRQYG